MGESWNDHLRYEYGKLKNPPSLLSFPFELLEKVLDDVSMFLSSLSKVSSCSRHQIWTNFCL